MTNDTRRLAALANGQLGVFSRAQAREAGLDDRQLRSRVQSGSLVPCGPNSFRVAGTPTSPRGEVLALLLDVGGDARASGPTAAALHRFDGFPLRRPFHVTIGRGRDVQRVGHHIHTTTMLPLIDRATVEGIATTSAARTLIDLARDESPERLTVALDSALRDGLVSEDLLHRRIVALRTKGRFGVPRLLEVLDGSEIIRGGHSWLEREFLRLVHAAGLPRPDTQVVLARTGDRTVRVDFRFPGTRLVVEVLGYRFHRTKDQIRRDSERLNVLILDGQRPLQFTYDQVVDRADHVIDTLRWNGGFAVERWWLGLGLAWLGQGVDARWVMVRLAMSRMILAISKSLGV